MDNTIELKIGDRIVNYRGWIGGVDNIEGNIIWWVHGVLNFITVKLINGEPVNGRKIVYKGNEVQEKVTLKVGDILAKTIDDANNSLMTIIEFSVDKIRLNNRGGYWCKNLTQPGDKFYVNGKLYASENIIVPNFKEKKVQKVIHDSDCSLHNEPAYPNGDCDCSVMSTQEITKDNIVEVLKHNEINPQRYKKDDETIECFSDVNNVWVGTTVLFKCPEWLQIVEVYFGKLKPLPKANPFDVVKVGQWVRSLVDVGFTRDGQVLISNPNMKGSIFWISIHEAPKCTLNGSINIEPTPENAKIIIEMANLAKGIK